MIGIVIMLVWIVVSMAIMAIGNAFDNEGIMIAGAVLLLLSFTIVVV